MKKAFLLILAAVLPLAAQDSGLQAKFAAQALPAGLGKIILSAGESASEPFDLPKNNFSEPQKLPGRVFQVKTQGGAKQLSTVTLPEEGRSFIILMVPGSKEVFTPVVIPNDKAAFKPGDVYLYNHSKKTVLALLGESKASLKSGSGQVVKPTGIIDDTFYNVAIGVREEKGPRAISSTRWNVSKVNRSYIFFFDNPETKDIDYRAIDEFIAPN